MRSIGRPAEGGVMQPDLIEYDVSCRRGIFRSLINFYKRGTCNEFDNGRVWSNMFKGFTDEDEEFKYEIDKALKAFSNTRTDGYSSKKNDSEE